MKKRYGIAAIMLGAFIIGSASLAGADPLTFNFIFDGASIGNTALGQGYITFEDTLLPNPSAGNVSFSLPGPEVIDLSMTITGAPAGNGTYDLADFFQVNWGTGGATLDLTQQLVGQPTSGSPWGTADGEGGDFNLISGSGPSGIYFFTLGYGLDGEGEGVYEMVLTSMVAAAAEPVPEPATMLLLGTGLVGVAGAVRKRKNKA